MASVLLGLVLAASQPPSLVSFCATIALAPWAVAIRMAGTLLQALGFFTITAVVYGMSICDWVPRALAGVGSSDQNASLGWFCGCGLSESFHFYTCSLGDVCDALFERRIRDQCFGRRASACRAADNQWSALRSLSQV